MKTSKKTLAACFFALLIASFSLTAFDVFTPTIAEDAALNQMDLTEASAVELRGVNTLLSWIPPVLCVFSVCVLVALAVGERKGRQKAILALPLLVLGSGCRPYDVPEFEEVGNSETAFLVPLEGDIAKQKSMSKEDLASNVVVAKRVQITHRWVSTGRMPWTGEYVDTVRLIKVDRAPVTVKMSDQNGIWVESRDSVGFSTGISITGRIPDRDASIIFLQNYPGDSLAGVLEDEVKERCQKIMAAQSAKSDMDELRALKNEMISAVEQDIVPFFSERGIEITNVANFGGFLYQNEKIQQAIDKVFEAQQDKNVAIAEFEAAEQRKAALKSLGEGKASQLLEERRGEAEGIRLVAEAKAYEVEKMAENPDAYMQLKQLEIERIQAESWDGKYPYYLFNSGSEGNVPSLLMNVEPKK